ncbi:hypothetical protein [Couchioplanes caeruleus]|uniref:Uncharacterized protein n=1 Tax=Couchioplanes caeruleus subsp. caeruleus TaxID=56427 RepID=A0A1K0FJI0_9ACTN|nr:hypothetical protein [Couchioplanes caeruleus]OJF12985.1 hypothetical protein BG844_17585 [Couchioplanes caeruleus subsp. caeruleus]
MSVDFFGTRVDYVCRDDRTHSMLEYYLRPHVRTPTWEAQCRLQVALLNSGGCSFQRALTYAGLEKRIYANEGDGWRLYDRFFAKSSRPTPLPPLSFPGFRGGYRSLHAAAACSPGTEAKAVMIRGESGAGKSSLLLALLVRGWGFLSDDVCVVRRADSRIVPYGRPIGVRAPARAMLERFWKDGLMAADKEAISVSTRSGRTSMLRSENLGFMAGAKPVPLALEVMLTRGTRFEAIKHGPAQITLRWTPESDLWRASSLIEEAIASL